MVDLTSDLSAEELSRQLKPLIGNISINYHALAPSSDDAGYLRFPAHTGPVLL